MLLLSIQPLPADQLSSVYPDGSTKSYSDIILTAHPISLIKREEKGSLYLDNLANEPLFEQHDPFYQAGDIKIQLLEGKEASAPDRIEKIAIDAQSHYLVLGAQGGKLKVVDFKTGLTLHRWKAHKKTFLALAISPDGKRIVSAGKDKQLKLWDQESGEHILTFGAADCFFCFQKKSDHEAISHLVISPDNRIMLSASLDNEVIQTWDMQTGEALNSFSVPGLKAPIAITHDSQSILYLQAGGTHQTPP